MQPYQDFALLFTVRDAVIHVKAIDQEGPRKGETVTFAMPKIVKRLQTKKLAKASSKDVGSGWFDAFQTEPMASWACKTALMMMLAVLDLIPAAPGDPTRQFKDQFRRFKALT
jgi:hypothetical protein